MWFDLMPNNMLMIVAVVAAIMIIAAASYFFLGAGPHAQTSTQSTAPSSQQSSTVAPANTTANNTHGTNSTNATKRAGTGASNGTVQVFAIRTRHNATIGNYLVNSTGWTLYLYTNDKQHSGTSNCYGSCASYWPPFYAANLTLLSSLNASAFGTITRTGGGSQTTYEGWPLYHYLGDKAPGELNGQGIGGTWYAVTVPNITTSG